MYPFDFEADYGDGRRSRGLAALGVVLFLKWLALIPHVIIVGVLGFASAVVSYVGYWVIVITGELPEFFYTVPERVLQWQARLSAWLFTLSDEYPPFEWTPQGYGAQLMSTEAPGERNRALAVLGIIFLKPLAAIPHFIALSFVVLASLIAIWVGYVAVLFTGTLPRGIFDFTVGAVRWTMRVNAWLNSLTDEYPPFSMSE